MRFRQMGVLCIALLIATSLALGGCSTGSPVEEKKSVLDPENPVQIEVWTYYNGKQQQAFEQLVTDFNATSGKDMGVNVAHASQGGVNDLAQAVTDSAQELVGSASMPDMFLSYPDTAFVIDELDKVADLSPYVSDEEKGGFVEDFLAEGDINGDGSFKVFPISKATETLQINLTDWKTFAEATGSTQDELSTIEGVTAVAQRYYEWTDAQTETPNDGKPFFGRDSLANYLLTGSMQLGHEMFDVQDNLCTPDIDKATMRQLWDNYYIPMVNGYFSSEGRFRSDALKTGDLICYVGSSSSVVYFPAEVTVDDQTSYPIEFGAFVAPVFAKGTPCAPQQGAGFVVTKADERTETACVEFLKWLTEKEQNTGFSIEAGYIPVKKEALTEENIESVAADMQTSTKNYLINLPATLETVEAGLYGNAPFKGGVEARVVLESSLSDRAKADRAAVLEAMASGASREEAIARFATDENFDAWFESFVNAVNATIGKSEH
ncbi:MAG: extracellular solute-binding protein [Raoultibacter sp.]